MENGMVPLAPLTLSSAIFLNWGWIAMIAIIEKAFRSLSGPDAGRWFVEWSFLLPLHV
jgi:hypothetical protein